MNEMSMNDTELLRDATEYHSKGDSRWFYEWPDGSKVYLNASGHSWGVKLSDGKHIIDCWSTALSAARTLAFFGEGPASVKPSQKEEGQPHAGRRLFKKGDKVRRSQEAFGDHSFVAKVTRDELDDGKCWFADEGVHETWNPHYLMVLVEAVESAPPAKRRLFNKGDCVCLRGYPHELYWCITDEDSDRWEVNVSKTKDGNHCCSFSTRNHNCPGDMILIEPSPACGSHADSPESPDMVNHPPHYTKGGIEAIDAIQAALTPEEFRGYLKGQVFKYCWREKHKGGDEDLQKAQWYLERLNKCN